MIDGLTSPELTADALPGPEGYDSFHPFISGVFSQWSHTAFNLRGRSFGTAEQWMMFAKAELFEDHARAEAILATDVPAAQKRHGQKVSGFDPQTWDRWKVAIVYEGNLAKFGQNAGALRQLRQTAPAMLVEAARTDWIWGVGLGVDDPAAMDPSQWKGSNLLGRVLTKVRDDLSR